MAECPRVDVPCTHAGCNILVPREALQEHGDAAKEGLPSSLAKDCNLIVKESGIAASANQTFMLLPGPTQMQSQTFPLKPEEKIVHLTAEADNVLLKRGAEGHLAVKLIDFGSACYECYPCTFDVREEMSSHIAAEWMKGSPGGLFAVTDEVYLFFRTVEKVTSSTPHNAPRHITEPDYKYIQHTSKEDEMADITTMEKTEDGWEAFQGDMAILAFFERPISMCVLSGWMGGLPEGHGHPGLLRATHQYVCLVRMDGRPSRGTWPSWPSSSDPSVCVSCQDGWEAFQRDMAILAFFERPISMCVLSGWMGGLPERHGHPGLIRATHQYVCLGKMDGRPSRETWPSWPSSSDPSVCVSWQDGWEEFRRDMSILSFFKRFFDDPLRGGVARIMYDAYVILMNQSLPLNCKELTSEGVGVTKQHANLLPIMKTAFGQPTPSLQLHHKGHHHLESETNSRKGKRASTV
ncbi:hypothetical protein Bbelb_317830 [Branchiostoma belcheri]|nr:hypothetical protein Bbelb_317830 [Branchiostoma belcheri]